MTITRLLQRISFYCSDNSADHWFQDRGVAEQLLFQEVCGYSAIVRKGERLQEYCQEKDDIQPVMKKLTDYLKPGGIFYVSFKYGSFSGERNGRYFTDFDEKSFNSLIRDIPELTIAKQYVSQDVRPGRANEKWLNVFLKKI